MCARVGASLERVALGEWCFGRAAAGDHRRAHTTGPPRIFLVIFHIPNSGSSPNTQSLFVVAAADPSPTYSLSLSTVLYDSLSLSLGRLNSNKNKSFWCSCVRAMWCARVWPTWRADSFCGPTLWPPNTWRKAARLLPHLRAHSKASRRARRAEEEEEEEEFGLP